MHLWTEYEGRTVDEHYTLGKLLRSEGRNGFFATADKDGHPAVIRLTEAHYDEAELLNRWRHVAEVHQDNLIEIEQVGQTTLEGVALTYALMEPDDANLGDVLRERPLTTAETTQVAKAVLAAVQALHASGLVHEHIEPANVLAVGETVKLRSDCVRECVADGEFSTEETCAELRRKDLHDFGLLLLRCLTLETEWSTAHHNLPDPFKRIIPRALDGSWTLEQLGTALDPAVFGPKPASRPAYLSQATPVPAEAASMTPAVPSMAAKQRPLVPPGVRQEHTSNAAVRDTPQRGRDVDAGDPEPAMPLRSRFRAEPAEPTHEPSKRIWVGFAVAALLILLIRWHFFSGKPEAPATTSRPAALASEAPVRAAQPTVAVPSAPTAVSPEAAGPLASTDGNGTHAAGAPGWYVIAYTYNREGQAATKAQRLRRTHDSLHPQVFTPTGHGPYLVSLGGAMSETEAEAVYRHARRAGLPRDTFVRHY